MEQQFLTDELKVSDELRAKLDDAARWAKVAAVIGLVSGGLEFILNLRKTQYASAIIYLGLTILVNVMLLKFSNGVRTALVYDHQYSLSTGIRGLKNYFKVTSWIIIGVLVLFLLLIMYTMVATPLKHHYR